MFLDKNSENLNKWMNRKKNWKIQILIAGCTGLIGSITTAVSEMESMDISNFFNLKTGTYFIMLFWLVGMGIGALIIWFLCIIKVKIYETKIKDDAFNQYKKS